MKIQQIREIAREHGLNPGKATGKIELIKAIQRQEGNFDCLPPPTTAYATTTVACGARIVLPRHGE